MKWNSLEYLNSHSRIVINEKLYKLESLVKYCTFENPKDYYYKIITSEHKILVLSPSDKLIYFGRVIEKISDQLPNKDLLYKGEKYQKINSGYQMVVKIIQGEPQSIEGEVNFIDFIDGDKKKILSLAIESRTMERVDVFAEIIDADHIKIMKREIF